ncbi:MAG: 1,4-dihydroxy-2-naphthoate octaprenyltransferase [Bacteroidales bacterium]|nr:1,4-dihydroxy-2-naphthoate octaprenyltransferase [Bacteroidales bacterium]
MNIKACIRSLRLRTLPLSMAGIVAGLAISLSYGSLDTAVVITLITTTALLQILTNLSNELGDTLKGTDTAERQGIRYSLQDGEISIPQMKGLIATAALLCCISGLAMIHFSFGTLFATEPLLLIVLGAAAIWAAMRYTLGKNPYGYNAKGDISVFIFFGLVSVAGSAYVCTHSFSPLWLLPAAAIGCWSVAVLNVNNIRDMKSDAATRVTIAMKLGVRRARIYQTLLICIGWLLLLTYSLLNVRPMAWVLCFMLTIPLFVIHLKGVWTREDKALDPMLPLLVMASFATALIMLIGAWAGLEL